MSPSINKKLQDIKAMCSSHKRVIDPDREHTTPLKYKKLQDNITIDVKNRQLEKHFLNKTTK